MPALSDPTDTQARRYGARALVALSVFAVLAAACLATRVVWPAGPPQELAILGWPLVAVACLALLVTLVQFLRWRSCR